MSSGKDYYLGLEDNLNDIIISWGALQQRFVVITGDLNMDNLKQEGKEGKILCDLEQIHNLDHDQPNSVGRTDLSCV